MTIELAGHGKTSNNLRGCDIVIKLLDLSTMSNLESVGFAVDSCRSMVSSSSISLLRGSRSSDSCEESPDWFTTNEIVTVRRLKGTDRARKYADLMLVYGVYALIKKLSYSTTQGFLSLKCLHVITDQYQKQAVIEDRNVSRDFINKLNHLMANIRLCNLNVTQAKAHIFFATAQQQNQLICEVSSVYNEMKYRESEQYIAFVLEKDLLRWKDTKDDQDTFVVADEYEGFNWRSRTMSPLILRREVLKFVEGSRAKFVRKKSAEAKSRSSQSTNDVINEQNLIATFYEGHQLGSLLKLIRNLTTHWLEPKVGYLRTELMSAGNASYTAAEKFNFYWTSRFPGLMTTIYVYALREKVHHFQGSQVENSSAKYSMIVSGFESVPEEDKQKLQGKVVEMNQLLNKTKQVEMRYCEKLKSEVGPDVAEELFQQFQQQVENPDKSLGTDKIYTLNENINFKLLDATDVEPAGEELNSFEWPISHL